MTSRHLCRWDRMVSGAYLQRKHGGRAPSPVRAARIASRYGANLSRGYGYAVSGCEPVMLSRRAFWEWLQRVRAG